MYNPSEVRGMLSYLEIVDLINMGHIVAPVEQVKGASLDIRLAKDIFIESSHSSVIDPLNARNSSHLREIEILASGYIIRPGQIFLGATVEKFSLPNDVVAELTLKSSTARCFLNHCMSDHIDPGFQGYITLEMKNENEMHSIRLHANMPIAQLKFYRVTPVPTEHSYSEKGQYNNDSIKPVRSRGSR